MAHKKRNLILFLSSILICFIPAAIGGVVTGSAVNTWYATLHKPSFNPPNWLFGPVWTVLYLMQGISLFLIRKTNGESIAKLIATSFFSIQLILNLLWSILFFGFHSPLAGLLEIGLLIISVIFTIIAAFRIHRVAGLLLLPYLAWISFASFLNFTVFQLNR